MSGATRKPQVGDVVVILQPAPYVEDATEYLVGSLGVVQELHGRVVDVYFDNFRGVLFWPVEHLAIVGDVR